MRATAVAANVPTSGAIRGRAEIHGIAIFILAVAIWVKVCGRKRIMKDDMRIEHFTFDEIECVGTEHE